MPLKYELFLMSKDGLAILNGSDGKLYKAAEPYEHTQQITYTEYENIAYAGIAEGTCYPQRGLYEEFKHAIQRQE